VTPLKIGTRGSPLALWQARTVAALLGAGGTKTELVIIRTAGDRLQSAPLSEEGGKRLFVKDIEDALLRKDVDLAVHSAKDMPAEAVEALTIAAVLPREDPRDALILPEGHIVDAFAGAIAILGDAPSIGTGSVRRIAQLTPLMPRATFAPIRGNVDTRLRKLDGGGFNALVLAAAGLRRLGFAGRISAAIPVEQCVPAPGQGIVAIEIRSDDARAARALKPLDNEAAAISLNAERAVVAALGGGCQLPLGAIAMHENGGLRMLGVVASPDGRRLITREASGATSEAAAIGRRLADALASGGGREILDALRMRD
jgi:hydroxymethylbilane synthase